MPKPSSARFPSHLSSQRLSLRQLTQEDVDVLTGTMLLESERYEGSFARTLALVKKDPKLYFQECQKGWSEGSRYRLGVWFEESFAGLVGLRTIDLTGASAELFYFVTGAFEGRGIAYESTLALVNYARLEFGLVNLWLRVVPGNARSGKLAFRLGFTPAEVLPQSYTSLDGTVHDTQVYRLQQNNVSS